MSEHTENGEISRKTALLIGLVFLLGISVLYIVARQSSTIDSSPDKQEASSSNDPVLAKVNGDPITNSQLDLAMSQWTDPSGNTPPLTRAQALERLIQQRLLVKLGENLDVGDDLETQNRLRFTRDQLLAENSAKAFLTQAVSEAEVQDYYDNERRIRSEQIQIKARQIVTPDEATAREIIRRLDKGEAFATLALAFSLDRASRESGGDMGYLIRDMLDPLLSDKIFAAADGTRLEPFETPLGWHIVEVIGRRSAPIPKLEERRGAILALLRAQKLDARLNELRQNANLQIFQD